jgi:L-asparaginase II
VTVKCQVTVETTRGGYVESRSRVWVVAQDQAGREILGTGDAEQPVFWRSSAKFVQALSLFTSGAADRFGFTSTELALACGSHAGGPEHVAVAARMLERIGATIDDLHCGPHTPLGSSEARALAASGLLPTKLHNNCSGKHAGMLAACRARGWPLARYNRIDHPLQQEILGHLSTVASVPREQIQTAVDGCGAVVFRTPLGGLATSFRRWAGGELPEPYQAAGERLRCAVTTAPEMVAGPGQLCTDLMRKTGGRLLAKIGAEGVYGLGTSRGPHGAAGLALKIEDGSHKGMGPTVLALLRHLGWIDDGEHEALREHWHSPLLNHQREHVGDIRVRIDATP